MVEAMDSVEKELDEEYVQLKMSFPILKNACDPIALNPRNSKNAVNLKEALMKVRTPILQKYSDYLLMPILIHLADKNKSNKSETLCTLLSCLKLILKRISIDNENQFWKVCSLTFQTIYSEGDDDYASKQPEELKLAVVECLSMLFKNATVETLKEVYQRKSLGRLSVVVFHTAQLTKKEKFIELRIAALRCIQHLLQLRDSENTSSPVMSQVAELTMLMLPGIVSCAVGVATSTDTLNHKIVVEAVHLWGRVIGLVMKNRDGETDAVKTFSFDHQPKKPDPMLSPYSQASQEDPKPGNEWFEASGMKLAPVTEKILNLQQHDHWRVRRQLVSEINHILTFAARNMRHSVKHLVDALICLCQDANGDVAKAAKESLDRFSKSCEQGGESKKLVEIVEESFYSLVTRLPRVLHGFDLSLKERQLMLLAGYIDVLGAKRLPGLLNSVQHLNRLLKSLYTAATLDCSSVTLLEEQAVRELDQESTDSKTIWTTLKHSNSVGYVQTIQRISRKLLVYSDSCSIIHSLLDDFEKLPVYRKEITLLLSFMFTFDSDYRVCVDHELTDQVLNTVMVPSLWVLPVQITSAEERVIAQGGVVQICLLADLVALLAVMEGPEEFSPKLLNCLYPLLECAGSPLYAISAAGFSSVGVIARLYGGDVGSLVARNVDYLSYNVTVNLRHVHRNPRVLSVLTVIVNNSTFDVFPSLYEIVKDVLMQSCDAYQDVNASAFLHVFLTFVSRLLEWEKTSNAPQKPKSVPGRSPWDQFYDYYTTSRIARSYKDDPPSDSEERADPMDTNDDDEEKKLPDHITLTVDILNRSLHFLPSKNTARQIQVLQILEKGVLVLSKWKSQLLPVVHKIWSPLVQRFSANSEPLIVHRSFVVLKTLATVSQEFIRNRTSKEVIPFLRKFLLTQAESLKKERDRSSYKMTQTYKLIQALVAGLGELIVCVEVGVDEAEGVVEAIIPFLSCHQPLPLQECAVGTLLVIAERDPHIVWVQLMDTFPCKNDFIAPSSNLKSVKMCTSLSNYDEFEHNVNKLMAQLR